MCHLFGSGGFLHPANTSDEGRDLRRKVCFVTPCQMELIRPTADELEVSVFGRGFGEAICVHLGDGEWVLADSCLNPETKEPAALSYFASIGISPQQRVRLVVVTHWDDDHVAGISRVVQECSRATVACSAALRREDILEFVITLEMAGGALGSGLDELRTILRLCRNSGRLVWAKANLPLHPRPPGSIASVVALSPSEDAVQRSIEALIEAATQQTIQVAPRFKSPEGPNGASVAVYARKADATVLLGADLETSPNPESGWDAVLTYAKPNVPASIVKVPHHGSKGAHHDQFWTDLVEDQVVAIVTPWVKGAGKLPTDDDLSRIRALTRRAYLTAMPTLKKVELDSRTKKLVRRLHGEQITELRGWGHVRARRRVIEPVWRVELDGDAVALSGESA